MVAIGEVAALTFSSIRYQRPRFQSLRFLFSALCLSCLTLAFTFGVYVTDLFRAAISNTDQSIFSKIQNTLFFELVKATPFSPSYGIDLGGVALILFGMFFAAFILITMASITIDRYNINAGQWPYLGAIIALKFLIVFALVNGSATFNWPKIPGPYALPFLLSSLLTGVWALYDSRSASLLRLIVLAGMAYLVMSFDADLELKAKPIEFLMERSPTTLGMLESTEIRARIAPFLLTKMIIEVSFLGFIIGWIHSLGLNKPLKRVYISEIIGLELRSLVMGTRLGLTQICAGVLAACCLAGLVTAQNTASFRGNDIWPNKYVCEISTSCLVTQLTSIPILFDKPASAHAIAGGLSALPFILVGSLILYGLSLRGITGILPVLGLGATLGYLWSFSVPEVVWTTQLSWHSLCSFIAMIIAAGGVAAAQAVPTDFRRQVTPPQSQPAL